MNALFARTFVPLAAFALTAGAVATQIVPVGTHPQLPQDPDRAAVSLRLNADEKYLVLGEGQWDSQFAVFLGLPGTEPIVLPNRLRLEFTPFAVLAMGKYDAAGQAFVPIDLQHDGLFEARVRIAIQAVAWTGENLDLPEQASNVLEELPRPTQTPLPDPRRDEPIYVVKPPQGIDLTVSLISTDSFPPEFSAQIRAIAPTGGFAFRVKAVLWNHDFARIVLAMERPAPGSVVTEALEEHRLSVDLGSRVEQAEIVIEEELVTRKTSGVGNTGKN